MQDISESDWKYLKKSEQKAIEAYCERCLSEFSETINKDESAHNRYLLMYRVVQNLNKKMELIFQKLSRSESYDGAYSYQRRKNC